MVDPNPYDVAQVPGANAPMGPSGAPATQAIPQGQPQIPLGATDSPFSYGVDTNQPGLFGVSRGGWRDIGNFLANYSNALEQRLPTGHLAHTGLGALGSAAATSLQQGVKNAQAASSLNYQGQQTLAEQLKNRLSQMQLPIEQQRLLLQKYYLEHPELMRGETPGAAEAPSGAASTQGANKTPVTPFVAKNLPEGVSPEEDQMVRTVYGEAGGEPIVGQQGVAHVIKNRMDASGQSAQDVMFAKNQFEPWNNPAVRAKLEALDPNSLPYKNILQNVVRPVMAGQAPDPTSGATNFYSPTAQAQLSQVDGRPVTPSWAAGVQPTAVIGRHNFYRLGYPGQQQAAPSQATPATRGAVDQGTFQIAQAGEGAIPTPSGEGAATAAPSPATVQSDVAAMQAGQARAAAAGGRPAGTQVAQAQGQGSLVPANQPPAQELAQSHFQKAQNYLRQASDLEYRQNIAKFVGVPGPAGDPALLRQLGAQENQKALDLQAAGPEALAKSQSTFNEVREKATAYVPGLGWVRGAHLEWKTNEDGSETYGTYQVPLPNEPPGTPPRFLAAVGPDNKPIIKPSPDVQAGRTELVKNFQGKDADTYLSAQKTQAWIEQMMHAGETMDQSGWSVGGPTNPARVAFAGLVNDVSNVMGIKRPFDPMKIASAEEFNKATLTAGFELASENEGHARQAAATIQNAILANPSRLNSPEGRILVGNGIREMSQAEIDLHEYKQDKYNLGGGAALARAEVDFAKQNPDYMYARRAISTVQPYKVTSDTEMKKYLPGTWIVYKGIPVQVPDREGAPATPGYLKGMAAPQVAPNG